MPRTFKNAPGSPLSNQSQEHDPPRFAGGAILMGLGGSPDKTVLRMLRVLPNLVSI